MVTKAVLAFCLLLCPAVIRASPALQAPTESAKGRMAVSVFASTQEQVRILQEMRRNDNELDFWTYPLLNRLTDVMVAKSRFNDLRTSLTQSGMNVSIKMEDVEKVVVNDFLTNLRNQQKSARAPGMRASHTYFRTFDQYVTDLNTLANSYPDLMSFDDSGAGIQRPRSINGEIIHYYELTNFNTLGSNRPVIFMEVLIHAREWITGSSVFYMTDWLLSNYNTNAEARNLLDNFHLVILPVSNPDGYKYSFTNDRFWRKNRRANSGGFCSFQYGVDLNRNFDAFWSSSEGSCSSQTFPGTGAESEPETQAIINIFNSFRSKAVMYLSVHSYSQLILVPWGYIAGTTGVNAYHERVGQRMAQSMQDVFGYNYRAGTPSGVLGYPARGTSLDWALLNSTADNFLSVVYELRPDGNQGYTFNIPASEIIPSAQEFVESVFTAADEYSLESGLRLVR